MICMERKVDKENLAKLDKKEKKEAEQGAEALATAMGAMAAAAQSVGVKPGEAPSASQEKAYGERNDDINASNDEAEGAL